MVLNYSQISMQLLPRVEKFNRDYPQNNSFQYVQENTAIYKERGLFVKILTALVGTEKGPRYDRFDTLCQQYQTTCLKDIPEQDANELWQEFNTLV